MGRYVLFLRGINISGKNKIDMTELKTALTETGFTEVSTYLNSGNVLLSSVLDAPGEIGRLAEKTISAAFGLDIPVYVVTLPALEDIMSSAPEWWGTDSKAVYDNLIFILTDDTPLDICELVGPVSDGLERIAVYKNVIFWSFDAKAYSKCSWWKRTASKGITEKLTIRTANTVKKLITLKSK